MAVIATTIAKSTTAIAEESPKLLFPNAKELY